MKKQDKVRYILWNILSYICLIGYLVFGLCKDYENSTLLLLLGVICDNRVEIIKLQNKIGD